MWTICIDVKLHLIVLNFLLLCLQGVVAGSRVYHQRRHSGFPGDTWPDQPCVPAFPIFVNGDRLSQVPACRLVHFLLWIMLHLNLPQNFGVNRFLSTVRFSQSEFLSISSDGTVAFSKDKERILLHWFSCLVIQLSPVRF